MTGDLPGRMLLLVVAACVCARLYVGVDFSDEAFYVGVDPSWSAS